VQNWNRPTAQCGPVFVLLPARSHTGLDWPGPAGLFPWRARLASSWQRVEVPTATCLPASTRRACSRRSQCSASSRPSSSQCRGKPHLSSPLHSNRRRVLTHSALPLTVHLHSKRWPLHPTFVHLHATALRKDYCSTEPASSFVVEAAFPSTAVSGAPLAPSTPPVASIEI
jgi:hypothetical protein